MTARRGDVEIDRTDLPEHTGRIEELFDEATYDTPNHGGILVFKFLQALVMPHRALTYLSANASSFQNPRVTFVRFPTLSEDMRKYPHAQIEEIKKEPGVGTHACTWAEDRVATYLAVNRHFLGNVHAEAAVMALSCLDSENLVKRVTKLPIGVSKKCCWTCWKLSQSLQSRDTRQTFDLADSHGKIYAWDPPEIGIPTAVLRDLSESLMQEVRVAAALDAEERESQASSPISGPSEAEEEDNGGDAGDLDLDGI
ncbi:hypothetical protein PENSPDRAFT_319905 [Peniophora sp. CONT]|nr:hypothetical protein PENSPDRAFT_319905 [Peniophora sp. CONT]